MCMGLSRGIIKAYPCVTLHVIKVTIHVASLPIPKHKTENTTRFPSLSLRDLMVYVFIIYAWWWIALLDQHRGKNYLRGREELSGLSQAILYSFLWQWNLIIAITIKKNSNKKKGYRSLKNLMYLPTYLLKILRNAIKKYWKKNQVWLWYGLTSCNLGYTKYIKTGLLF